MQQAPKTVIAKAKTVKKKKKKKKAAKISLPRMTRTQLEDLVSDSAIKQQLDKMTTKGLIPKESITADVLDAVRWQDSRFKELQDMNTQDIKDEMPWVDDLIEDFIVFDLSPNLTSEEAKKMLESFIDEVEKKWDSYGPEARDYMFKMKRELGLLVEKL